MSFAEINENNIISMLRVVVIQWKNHCSWRDLWHVEGQTAYAFYFSIFVICVFFLSEFNSTCHEHWNYMNKRLLNSIDSAIEVFHSQRAVFLVSDFVSNNLSINMVFEWVLILSVNRFYNRWPIPMYCGYPNFISHISNANIGKFESSTKQY